MEKRPTERAKRHFLEKLAELRDFEKTVFALAVIGGDPTIPDAERIRVWAHERTYDPYFDDACRRVESGEPMAARVVTMPHAEQVGRNPRNGISETSYFRKLEREQPHIAAGWLLENKDSQPMKPHPRQAPPPYVAAVTARAATAKPVVGKPGFRYFTKPAPVLPDDREAVDVDGAYAALLLRVPRRLGRQR